MKSVFINNYTWRTRVTSRDLCVGVHLHFDLFTGEAAFLSKTNCKLILSCMQPVKEYFIHFILTCVSFPSACDCVIGAGLVLTGSWWGVMRAANSHNLSLEADQLVTSKFIQRVLSLHLPYFEVAPFHLCFSVRDRVFISSSATVRKDHARKPRRSCVLTACVPPSVVCSHQAVFLCVQESLQERKLKKRAPIYTCFGGFKVILSCFAKQQSSSSQSKRCLIQQ